MTATDSRKWIILAIVLPVAAIAGFCLASPDLGTVAFLGGLVVVMLIPFVLRWHHTLLVLTWNLTATVFFLPGNPPFWMLASLICLAAAVFNRTLDKKMRFLHVPSITWTIVILMGVVLFTMYMTGGLGLRSFGSSSHGGKKYVFLLFAAVGYFAISMIRIPPEKAEFHVLGYFASGVSPILSQIVYALGSGFWFLFLIIPADPVVNQAMEDFSGPIADIKFGRKAGFAFAGMAAFTTLMAKYGLRGILDFSRPWRAILAVAIIAVSLMGGFRSVLIVFALMIVLQFFLEGMHRTQWLPLGIVSGVVGFVFLLAFAQRLPLSIQRSLSILPIEVSPAARMDAQVSTDWRLEMWSVLVGEIPRYLWLGKGNTASETDFYLATESFRRGLGTQFDTALVAGDYHNGPLSIVIPFGVPGLVAFLAFLTAAFRVLILNRRYGLPELRAINTFLLTGFSAKVAFFLFFFGGFHSDFPALVGLLGLSVSLNGGLVRHPTGLQPA